MIYIDPQNWSYSEDEMLEYKDEKTIFFNSKKILNMNEKIPEKFRFNSKREAEYLFNENGFKNLKILIFRDSSTSYLKNFMQLYCKELLCYWDHWSFNKELIEWYKLDIIIEIRTERLLENMKTEIDKRESELIH